MKKAFVGLWVISLGVLLVSLTLASPALATTINVPGDQPTIQAGIDAAGTGDTVLVAPGTYFENIDFKGKAISLASASGPKVTIIDGAQKATVVSFISGETTASVIRGFTIQNGNATTGGIGEGGGISVQNSSATIVGNIITNNQACEGDGIGVGFGSPVIRHNVISKNFDGFCGGIGGGGVGVRGASSAQIVSNTIINNSTGSYGGGIALWSGNAVLIQNNTISGNTAQANGGGISMFNDVSSVVISQNLVKDNRSATGNGIYWSNPPLVLVSNTINDSARATGGSTVWADGFCCNVMIENNVIVASGGAINAFTCNFADFPVGAFSFNDAFSKNGPAYGGLCTNQTGSNGNISANPLFVNVAKGNYQLRAGSPAIDAGNNTAPDLPSKDLAGKTRIVDGNGDGTAVVDMGAYEFQ